MRIHGLTVCVNYADLLSQSIDRWRRGFESLTIVTDKRDVDTLELAIRNNALPFVTDAFYENGAAFNKGAAQQEAWPVVPKDDWILLFDADILPPMNWKQQLDHLGLSQGFLYGCYRYDQEGTVLHDDSHGYGYFQLFHGVDVLAQHQPFFDTNWKHAGNGDSSILLRWRDAGRLAPALPLKVQHAGVGPSHNWFGRGKQAEFDAMEHERRRRGGGWQCLAGEQVVPDSSEPLLNR